MSLNLNWFELYFKEKCTNSKFQKATADCTLFEMWESSVCLQEPSELDSCTGSVQLRALIRPCPKERKILAGVVERAEKSNILQNGTRPQHDRYLFYTFGPKLTILCC